MREHTWHRPHFHGPDFCRDCGAGRYSDKAKHPCTGTPLRVVAPSFLFGAVERTLVDYLDATLPRGSQTLEEAGSWYAEIKGYRIDLSAIALAITQEVEKRS